MIGAIVLLGLLVAYMIVRQVTEERDFQAVAEAPVATETPELAEEEMDAAVPVTLDGEDCLSFNSQNLQVQTDGSRFLLTDGRSRMMVFDSREGARLTALILDHYDLDNQCFAVRPNPGLRYFTSQGDLPEGELPGEDCIRIRNLQNLAIEEAGEDLFVILDGNSRPFSAKSLDEAERIIEIVQHYNARFTCYVERHDPGMVYLRR